MSLDRMEIILHPVRFRIIQKFLGGQSKTAKQISKELKDIPQATLYRHLDTLVKAKYLKIIEENQIRGTVEKVYALKTSAVHMTNDDIQKLTREDHLKYFLFFTAQITEDFEAYLSRDHIDFQRDGVGYKQISLNLSNEEFLEFTNDVRKVQEKYLTKQPSSERTKRVISTIVIPEL